MFALLIFTLIVLHSKPVLSQWAITSRPKGHYIAYSGLISGRYQHPQEQIDRGCPDYNLGPYNGSYLFVGQFPFDSNPFFFELYHLASGDTGGHITLTQDSIYNLDFTSVGYPCMKNGRLCGSYVVSPWYYVVAEILDLGIGTGSKRAFVERESFGDKLGYKVSGDQTSFISNGTIANYVDIARPGGLRPPTGCMYDVRFIWNSSVPFTYDLTFTQTSASMSLYITTARGALTLSFNGTMKLADAVLVTTDPNVPKFNITSSATPTRKGPFSAGREPHHMVLLQVYAIGILILGISLLM